MEIDSTIRPDFTEVPQGDCSVETYTITHSRSGPDKGIVIGRLKDGTRFIANTERDPATLEYMCQEEMLNAFGTVSSDGKRNIFKPNL